MSPKLPAVTSKELARVAQRLGFEFRRLEATPSMSARAISGAW